MKHLLEIGQLSYDDCLQLLNRAVYFKSQRQYPQLAGLNLANLFYEPSTRTRISFEMAAKNLGIRVVNMDFAQSSETKGETIEDTIQTLHAMGIQLFTMRHKQNGLPQLMSDACSSDMHIINAGDGTHEHPSQALLDMMTIMQYKPQLEKLKIAIVGDVLHSRVANSLQSLCSLMKVRDLVLVAPEIWHSTVRASYGSITSSLRHGLQDADVVIALRVQRERLQINETMDLAAYHREYAITQTSLAWAKPDAIVLHPGPMNRGIEIDSNVADGPRSCILEQVKNGVFMRMAILEALNG
ncbi:MAG: aspartate carbamoyltransferase catalytic subunit [Legionellaceae bacterium]|nr:aspartate carbamoyltransferase catalytic subunit [Legionellaceae bacterium]MBP9775252.1 aspartate carbamoyltransferase catalytic subunit [Legionellaceae bacterium]